MLHLCITFLCYTSVFLASGGALLWRPRNKVGHKSCAGEHFSQLALLLNKEFLWPQLNHFVKKVVIDDSEPWFQIFLCIFEKLQSDKIFYCSDFRKNACVSRHRYQILYAPSGKWKGWAYPLHESLENTVCQLFTQLTQRSLRGMQNSGDEFSHFNFNSNSSST